MLQDRCGSATFRTWATCSVALIAKLLALLVAEGFLEMIYRSFELPEDLVFNDILSKKTIYVDTERNLDRIRMAQHNDLLNGLPLILIGLLFVLADPPAGRALMLLRIATLARYVHTALLLFRVLPQPMRLVAFLLPVAIMVYMCAHTLKHFMRRPKM